MNFGKFMKNSKAISPIFATLILIAIAVIAGVVVYMFTSGTLATMTGQGTAGSEKVAIQAVQAKGTTLTVYAQSLSGGKIVLDSIIVKDAAGSIVGSPITTFTYNPTGGIGSALTTVGGTASGLNVGDSYTVTLVSKAGGSFVSPSFKAEA